MLLSTRNRKRAFVGAGLLFLFFISFGGCSAPNYGRLESRKAVQQAFQNHQTLPDHKYYYAGVRSKPTVIVGINQNYQLTDRMWIEIDSESEDFGIIIDRVSLLNTDFRIQAWGFVILDPEGQEAGVWYSIIRSAAVRIDENGQINKLYPMGQTTVGPQKR